ncbi:MAG: VWA domain-containing protein [Desulfobulbus sp.]|jgi:nitric oxide reductase NorD protein|uniref:nitric oxide reductase activation protein NorD n=1 Tax=Desulfobulbus sp. TaxID=895 RepID=UPI0028490822|nr:VWA domain-containing protein [Desulfobulbus sp.]MDR2549355.1 VWA domain-containing protein [Desulfobulbus sp.]
MDLERLKEKFYLLVAPSLPNEWDVEDALGPLAESESACLDEIFAQIPAIWPVSHALCFAYLSAAGPALCYLALDELSLWVHTLLDRYETAGLHGAQLFMADVDQQFARPLRGQGCLRLADVRSRLQPYVNGLAGRELPLIAAVEAATDSEAIFLPGEVGVFAEQEENFLLYKLMVSFQWASLAAGVFIAPRFLALHRKSAHPLDCFFSEFPQPDHARRLFHLLETGRVLEFLRQELPGLMRSMAPLLPRLPLTGDEATEPNVLDWLQRGLLRGQWPADGHSPLTDRAMALMRHGAGLAADNAASLEAVRELMVLLPPEEDLATTRPLIFQGIFRLQEMRNLGMKQRMDKELRLMQATSISLPAVPKQADTDVHSGGGEGQGYDAALIMEMERAWDQLTPFMQSQAQQIGINEMPPPTGKPSQEHGPTQAVQETVSATEGRAGSAIARSPHAGGRKGEEMAEPVVYDEWDYRRKGFRKKWCVVSEKELPPVQNAFIEQTLKKYRGQIRRLRHQFELLQTGERFVRRQREGNDIDIDALVESRIDIAAGLPPSDRLFIRLTRDHRDIAVTFLVDMSNSTSGWVGQSIKEALVLICEAMEVLDDRYAIYGFSGMRRLRCEIFPVKRIDERYSKTVRQRISAIGPREYTRMAPAIRHMTSLFARVEAKIRLLIVLSDGKPEDYDDYKGDYAIEDTRHALLEAKAKGVHPFCITIDRQAHEYMAHMYGEVNYIFIDKIQRLPARMSEIYRTLTS